MITRYLCALSAAVSAMSAAMLAYPGDIVPQSTIVTTSIIAAGLTAMVAALKTDA